MKYAQPFYPRNAAKMTDKEETRIAYSYPAADLHRSGAFSRIEALTFCSPFCESADKVTRGLPIRADDPVQQSANEMFS
ncbi:MAG: hypothetical protein LUC45_02145 [Paraprevotella sp.]|nr:hypothetical protein [Paraprevotella sp.]